MTRPLPGTVRSDRQAFDQISARFRDEVGRISSRVNFVRGPVPFWALLRAMFPVAESLGDLIYRNDESTTRNLRAVLQGEFTAVRSGYAGKAALLAHLYRHSLVHHDELRVVTSGGRSVGWGLSGEKNARHLEVRRVRGEFYRVTFQPRAFYDDILAVCERARGRKWKGDVMRRYNEWLIVDLDAAKANGSVKAVREEIKAL
ncbi:MAG: hypothetical protein KJ018_20850 [Burkholderiales bacterium]|nr:hypothetical protein [Burkholderiales bacterium]